MNEEALNELKISNNMLSQLVSLSNNILQINKNIDMKVGIIQNGVQEALSIAKRELGRG